MYEFKLENILQWLPQLNWQKINLRNIKWIEPVAVSIINSLKLKNPKIEIIKSLSDDVMSYLYTTETGFSSKDKTYMPVTKINTNDRYSVEKVSGDIVEKILKNSNLHSNVNFDELILIKDYKDYLFYMVNEVLLNAVSHSGSEIDIVAFAQHYQNYKKTQVAIVDCGIGFKKTIARKYNEITTESEALKKAIQKGVTGAEEYLYQSAT